MFKKLGRAFLYKIILLIISFSIAVLITGYSGNRWEQPVRTLLYSLKGDSVPEYSVEIIDENGIPYVDYKTLNGITAGKQYNATIVCNYAINYYEDHNKTGDSAHLVKFFNCVRWLSEKVTVKGRYSLFVFNWQQPWYDSVNVPYTSGMTSGLAIKVFTLANRLTASEKYLQHAKSLVRGFYVPVNKGGFTYKDNDGWWYEELADSLMHTPLILDGHIFAVTGLYEYAAATKDDSAFFLFNKGVEALKNRLPLYDIGNGWSYYDAYRLPANRKYHRLLTSQLKELYDITGDTFFLRYYEKWNEPLSRWYVRRIVEDRNVSGLVLFGSVWLACTVAVLALSKFIRPIKV